MLDILGKASKAYYEGTPIMSDAEFDILSAHFDYNTVGHKITDGVSHYHKMYSLQNCFDMDKAPLDTQDCVQTPKLDGAAISIMYVAGTYSLALTRGNGLIGKDITDKIALLVPNKIPHKGIIQITGEVLAPKSIKNSRNYAAGSLGLKDVAEFAERDLTFVAYDCIDNPFVKWTMIMDALERVGFNVVTSFDVSEYPTDGIVYRINDMKVYKEMGYTRHHPRGAFAFKIQAQGVETTLLDVVWQVGRTGIVSPVAILEPVEIGGAMVAKATLHNIKYIEDLSLMIGCTVEVIRSGEVIPRIVRRV